MNWLTSYLYGESNEPTINYERIDILKTVTLNVNEEKIIDLPENGIYMIYIKSIDNKGGGCISSVSGHVTPWIISSHTSENYYPKIYFHENRFLLKVVDGNQKNENKEITYIIRIVGI